MPIAPPERRRRLGIRASSPIGLDPMSKAVQDDFHPKASLHGAPQVQETAPSMRGVAPGAQEGSSGETQAPHERIAWPTPRQNAALRQTQVSWAHAQQAQMLLLAAAIHKTSATARHWHAPKTLRQSSSSTLRCLDSAMASSYCCATWSLSFWKKWQRRFACSNCLCRLARCACESHSSDLRSSMTC